MRILECKCTLVRIMVLQLKVQMMGVMVIILLGYMYWCRLNGYDVVCENYEP